MYTNYEDQLACQRRGYQRHKEKRYQEIQQRRRDLAKWLREYKLNLKCSRCSENHPACLDFHHCNSGEKEYNISAMIHRGFSKENILAEIEKCIVLCSNCHRKETFK
jgi:hypothetical protein